MHGAPFNQLFCCGPFRSVPGGRHEVRCDVPVLIALTVSILATMNLLVLNHISTNSNASAPPALSQTAVFTLSDPCPNGEQPIYFVAWECGPPDICHRWAGRTLRSADEFFVKPARPPPFQQSQID